MKIKKGTEGIPIQIEAKVWEVRHTRCAFRGRLHNFNHPPEFFPTVRSTLSQNIEST